MSKSFLDRGILATASAAVLRPPIDATGAQTFSVRSAFSVLEMAFSVAPVERFRVFRVLRG